MSPVIPWNASWTGEDRYEVRPCRWAGGRLAIWSPHKPGEGNPIFAKPHFVRQRKSIVAGICTVCGEETHINDRWWFGLGHQVPDEGIAWSTTEAPVHHACAEVAMKVCPHIRRLGVQPEPFPGGAQIIFSIVGGPAVDSDYSLTLRGRKVVGHAKFAWTYVPRLAAIVARTPR